MANRKRLVEDLFTSQGRICASEEETVCLGKELAEEMEVGSVVSLEGPLGAGKTQLIKGIVRGMGCPDQASSPSFSLLHEYPGGRVAIFHFDFYRMENAAELETAGFDDCLAAGITLIEWGGKFPQALPSDAWRLELEILPGGERRITGRLTP